MNTPLRAIQVGTGGFGANWCVNVWPRLMELRKAEPVAVVDINPDHFAPAREHMGVPDGKCYTDLGAALTKTKRTSRSWSACAVIRPVI